MFKNYTFLYLFIYFLGVSQPSFGQQKAIDFSELEATVNEELKATNTPGAAVVVVVGDRVVFAKGFGVSDIEIGIPVNPDTLFRIASTTKMLTAAALVTLAEQGKIKLDAPVGNYLQGLSPKLARVTVHQLLSHTAGIRDGASFNGPHDDSALASFVRTWTDDYLIAEPGEIFSYSNLGYVLAARVLEEVTGKPFADAMNDLLFQPLGMRRTTLRPIMAMTYPLSQGHDILLGRSNPQVVRPFADDARYWANGGVFTSITDFSRFAIAFMNGGKIEGGQVHNVYAIIPNRARGYRKTEKGEITNAPLHDTSVKIPGGGLVSTAEDLARFAIAINTNQLVKPDTLASMWTKPKASDGKEQGYAMGFLIDDKNGYLKVFNDGGQAGTRTYIFLMPKEKFAVACMTNLQNAWCKELVPKIGQALNEK